LAQAREGKFRVRKTHTLRNRIAALIVVILVVTALVGLYSYGHEPPPSNLDKVILKTSMGDITIELYDDMPITTGNFKNLVSREIYDGTIFHRVIKDFMIQGGDPTGTGMGDPSIPAIEDEFTDHNRNDRGTIAMANAGPNTGSSQFFINLVNNNYLDSKHPVFGKVIDGMDVVDAIGGVATDTSTNKPLQTVMIFKAELITP
jgi:peptidylprolyl isomerase